MNSDLINAISKQIKIGLPGEKAQYKMAPSSRINDKITHNNTPIESSVLILLYLKSNKLYIPFIKRPVYNGVHSGQISLPGGKYEEKDKNLLNTALRETMEEIGVYTDKMVIIGKLTTIYIPVSNYKVTPYIAYLAETPKFTPSDYEVERIIEAPLSKLLSPLTVKIKEQTETNNKITIPYFDVDNHKIWGATAMIISELKELINSTSSLNSDNAHNDQISH